MRKLKKGDVEPVGKGYRLGSVVIFLCTLISIVGIFIFSSINEWIELGAVSLWFLFLIITGTHIFGSLAFTGYAPWYLLFAHNSKTYRE